MNGRPSFRQLEYVLAISERGTFSDAAASCGVTQPALSTQVRKLEESLGVSLFERRPTGAVPTPAGERVIGLAHRIVADVGDLVVAAQAMQDPLRGTLRLGVIPTVAPYLLPQIMPRLRERFPELRLLLREERTSRLTSLVHDGELDLILVALESDLAGLETRPLFSDPFVLAVSQTHRLARRKWAGAKDLLGEDVLLLDDGHCLRDQALAICDAAGACELGDFRATSLSTLLQMVEAGVGITLLPTMAVRANPYLRSHLRLIDFRSPVPGRTIAVAWRRSSPIKDALTTLAGVLTTEA